MIKLSPYKLKMVIKPMKRLQSLDIPWRCETINPLLDISSRLKELTITQLDDAISCEMLLTEWAKKEFIPETLQIIRDSSELLTPPGLTELWIRLNSSSPTDHIGYFRVYEIFERPMNLLQPPHYQLEFGQSCTLPLIQASKYGLFSLEKDLLYLTNCMCGIKQLSKAAIVKSEHHNGTIQSSYFNGHINSLAFLTHFNAHYCQLYSEHIEELAMACPKLLELDLNYNSNCLKNLKGLRTVASSCKHLQGLNLLHISVKDVENHVQLWEILVELKLTYLAIDLCVLLPHEVNVQVKDSIIGLQQKCSDLKALEVSYEEDGCDQCKLNSEHGDFLLLANFPSLVHLHFYTDTFSHPTAMKEILSGCKMLKYFINLFEGFNLSTFPLVMNCNLEQLSVCGCRCSGVDIPDTFMESVSTHGGLVHVELQVTSVTAEGVSTLIRNSPNLMTCRITMDHIYAFPGVPLKPEDFLSTLKKKFSNSKLFSCGVYYLANRLDNCVVGGYNIELFDDYFLSGHTSELYSLWCDYFVVDVLFND